MESYDVKQVLALAQSFGEEKYRNCYFWLIKKDHIKNTESQSIHVPHEPESEVHVLLPDSASLYSCLTFGV